MKFTFDISRSNLTISEIAESKTTEKEGSSIYYLVIIKIKRKQNINLPKAVTAGINLCEKSP